MHAMLALALVALAPSTQNDVAAFVAAVEKVELRINGKVYPRVERDAAGQVSRLRLDGMEFTPGDFRAIGELPALRYLSLRQTNTTSIDVAAIRSLPSLEYLVLTSTLITDEAVDYLVEMPALRTLCMGQVGVTPAGVERLKLHKPKLSLGYSPR